MDKLLKLSDCEFHISFGLSVVFTFSALIASHAFFRIDPSTDFWTFVFMAGATAVSTVNAALSIYYTCKRL
jgi:hypothetical protein